MFPHPLGYEYAPIRLSFNISGELTIQGWWHRYPGVKNHEGFAELASYLGQDHQGPASKVRAAQFDPEELWEVALRCAHQINGVPIDLTPDADRVWVEEVPTAEASASGQEAAEIEHLISEALVFAECELCGRFERHLRDHGRTVRRYRIRLPGASYIESDLADVTADVLYEAKGSADRMSVRLALGQVLDYEFHVKVEHNPEIRPAILLPNHPGKDLVELLEAHGVGCVIELSSGTFVDLTGLHRCP